MSFHLKALGYVLWFSIILPITVPMLGVLLMIFVTEGAVFVLHIFWPDFDPMAPFWRDHSFKELAVSMGPLLMAMVAGNSLAEEISSPVIYKDAPIIQALVWENLWATLLCLIPIALIGFFAARVGVYIHPVVLATYPDLFPRWPYWAIIPLVTLLAMLVVRADAMYRYAYWHRI